MNATELRQRADQFDEATVVKQLNEILDKAKRVANSGELKIASRIDERFKNDRETIRRLRELGFTVREGLNYSGCKRTYISW